MTTQQTIVIAIMWLLVAGLFVLVLLLYRSVDRAYGQASRIRQGGLLPGAEAPPVEILTGAGIDFLAPPAVDSEYLLGFVSGDCRECTELLMTLLDDDAPALPATLVIVDGKGFDVSVPDGSPIAIHPAAHPPDIQRGYGLTTLPMLYVMRNWTVLAVGTAVTEPQIAALMEEAALTDEAVLPSAR
jgi:hypothetical protein